MEGILLVIIGFGWFLFKVISEACITPATKGTDYRQVVIDGLICPKTTELYCPNLAEIYVRQSYGILSV